MREERSRNISLWAYSRNAEGQKTHGKNVLSGGIFRLPGQWLESFSSLVVPEVYNQTTLLHHHWFEEDYRIIGKVASTCLEPPDRTHVSFISAAQLACVEMHPWHLIVYHLFHTTFVNQSSLPGA